MGIYQINFKKVRKNDIRYKKMRPTWSGQDVLRDHLDHAKSLEIVEKINLIRVWPTGFHNIVKRSRCVLRLLVLSSFYDAFMTFAVLLNTIVLSLDSHTLSYENKSLLDYFNKWFTWIFIFELTSKLCAIGI